MQLSPPPSAPPVQSQPVPVPAVPERGGGLFGGKKKLEAENAELRAWVERLGGMDAMRVSAMIEALHAEH
ncbi:hypothetical protein [Streptosporangium sp. LJ11]|uniref:hypothetical protein n=1 Tax=Streptosporangium sp. LJ11 TaxID=3436927 RepID=UPI003F7AC269